LGVGRGADSHPVKLRFVSKPQLKPQKRKKVGEAMARKRAETLWKKRTVKDHGHANKFYLIYYFV
jgi:hypothetical protein